MKVEFKGLVFNDSDVYKWVEAVAFSIAGKKSDELHRLITQIIVDIGDAQDENGYLNTYFSFDRKKERWTNLRDMHESILRGTPDTSKHSTLSGNRGMFSPRHCLPILRPHSRHLWTK